MAVKRGILSLAVLLLASSVDGRAGLARRELEAADLLTNRFPFYHTSSALVEEASALAGSCAGFSLSTETDGEASLPVARLAALGTPGKRPELKTLMVFGEHARELISPETGLAWLRKLCSAEGAQLRQETSFVMVLDANPQGRAMVEGGEYCTRTNENKVDLNRNYGEHWQAAHEDDDESGVGSKKGQPVEAFSSGSSAFSEPQTRIIAKLLKATKPDVFLDVHSGTKGLFMPYDWTTDPIPNESDRNNMKAVLQEVNSKDCPECMVGSCAETVGYLAPGSSADYAYSQGVSFPFIWEIYADSADAEADAQDQRAFQAKKQAGASFLQGRTHAQVREHASAHLQKGFGDDVPAPSWAAGDEADMSVLEKATKEHCLLQFNPLTKDDYDFTVARWTSAFVTLCNSVRRVQGTA